MAYRATALRYHPVYCIVFICAFIDEKYVADVYGHHDGYEHCSVESATDGLRCFSRHKFNFLRKYSPGEAVPMRISPIY